MRRNPNLMKNGCPHSSASEIGRKTDARICQHPKSGEKRMPAFVSIRNEGYKWMLAFASIRNQTKNGCPRLPASEIRRKTDARIRQHPKSGEKRMPAFVSIRNQTKNGCPHLPASENRPTNGCSRLPASEIQQKKDARVCQHPK